MTNKMSFRHRWNLAYLADQRVPNARKFIVSFMMMEYANKNGTGAWPSEATLAERLGVSESTVKRAVAEAHGFGYLGRKRRFNASNMYEATIPMSHEDLVTIQAEDQVDEALDQILTEAPVPLVLDPVADMYDVPVDMVTPPAPVVAQATTWGSVAQPPTHRPTETVTLPGDERPEAASAPVDPLAEKTARYGPEWRRAIDAGDSQTACAVAKAVQDAERAVA